MHSSLDGWIELPEADPKHVVLAALLSRSALYARVNGKQQKMEVTTEKFKGFRRLWLRKGLFMITKEDLVKGQEFIKPRNALL